MQESNVPQINVAPKPKVDIGRVVGLETAKFLGIDRFTREPHAQGKLLFMKENFKTDLGQVESRVSGGSIDSRYDWTKLKQISDAERVSTTCSTIEEWNNRFTTWVNNSRDKAVVMGILSGLGVNDLTADGLKVMGTEFGQNPNGMKNYINTVLKMGNLNTAQLAAVRHIAGTLFGGHVSSEILTQIADLEMRINSSGTDKNKLALVAREIVAAKPTSESNDLFAKIEALLAAPKIKSPEIAKASTGDYIFEQPGHGLDVSQDAVAVAANGPLSAAFLTDGVSQEAFKSDEDHSLDAKKVRDHKAVLSQGMEVFQKAIKDGKTFEEAIREATEFLSKYPKRETMAAIGRTKGAPGQPDKLSYATAADTGIVVISGSGVNWLTNISMESEVRREDLVGGGNNNVSFKQADIPADAVVMTCSDGVWKNLSIPKINSLLAGLQGKGRAEIHQAISQELAKVQSPGMDDATFALI